MNLTPSFFCTQQCFKDHWPKHKEIHSQAKKIAAAVSARRTAPPQWAYGYNFSGSLRPAQQSATRVVPGHIKRPDYADDRDGRSGEEEAGK